MSLKAIKRSIFNHNEIVCYPFLSINKHIDTLEVIVYNLFIQPIHRIKVWGSHQNRMSVLRVTNSRRGIFWSDGFTKELPPKAMILLFLQCDEIFNKLDYNNVHKDSLFLPAFFTQYPRPDLPGETISIQIKKWCML